MARKNKHRGGGNPNRPRFWGKHAVAAALDNPERRVLKAWASREAASIMVGLYLVAAVVLVVAIPPALALGGAARRGQAARMLPNDGAPDPGLIL